MPLSFGAEEAEAAQALIELALAEDLGSAGDLTTAALFDEHAPGRAEIVARQNGVVAGLPIVRQVLEAVDSRLTCTPRCDDGTDVTAGRVLADVAGPLRSMLAAERTLLNFVCHLSGIATLTRQYVQAVAGTGAAILDTRKTLPGWRVLEKYAVRAGGGTNHRRGLFDAVLVKDNHIAAWRADHPARPLSELVEQVRSRVPPGTIIEIEVETLDDLKHVLPARPDIVLLDNMPPELLRRAVAMRDEQAANVLLEASGGVTLQTVRAIAESGVDRISVGALTHSAPALDLAFEWEPLPAG